MKSPKKEVKFSFRLSSQTKDELQILADAEKRKLGDYIRIELEKIVEQKKQNKSNG